MKLGNLEIMGDLALAPMAGVTDLAFRTICAELGAAVTVTEMVSSRALIYQDKKSRSLLHKTPLGVCGAQIFGNDPSVMADGAALALEASGADFIDINIPLYSTAFDNGERFTNVRYRYLFMLIGNTILEYCCCYSLFIKPTCHTSPLILYR